MFVCCCDNLRRQESKMQSFSELSISPSLKERLKAARFSVPTPVQAAAIPQALAGKDEIATSHAGTRDASSRTSQRTTRKTGPTSGPSGWWVTRGPTTGHYSQRSPAGGGDSRSAGGLS